MSSTLNSLEPEAKSSSNSDAATEPSPELQNIHVFPPDLGSLFAKRPLILGEDEAAYDALVSNVTQVVKPRDIIEAIWVKDFADLTWESHRLRRLKASLLMATRAHALQQIFTLDGKTINRWLAQDQETVNSIDRALKDSGYDLDSVMARALSIRLPELERIDRLISSADTRRNKALAEVSRRREASIRELRMIAEDLPSDASPS